VQYHLLGKISTLRLETSMQAKNSKEIKEAGHDLGNRMSGRRQGEHGSSRPQAGGACEFEILGRAGHWTQDLRQKAVGRDRPRCQAGGKMETL